jgi:hypothetical protein
LIQIRVIDLAQIEALKEKRKAEKIMAMEDEKEYQKLCQ